LDVSAKEKAQKWHGRRKAQDGKEQAEDGSVSELASKKNVPAFALIGGHSIKSLVCCPQCRAASRVLPSLKLKSHHYENS
jgi:hypothetical protein